MSDLKVVLLQHTPKPERTCALAARLCYSPVGIEQLQEKMSDQDCRLLLEKIMSIGHFSVLEHASFTFGIEGISRALSHQLVRHRLASYSQQSQRYVKFSGGIPAVIPESIRANEDAMDLFEWVMETCEQAYNELIEHGIPAEDARFVVPNAAETKIIMTMNARELLHFFGHRCCNRAQWEIRKMADDMLRLCYQVAPIIFEKGGPSCVSEGVCHEGKMCCGTVRTKEELLYGT